MRLQARWGRWVKEVATAYNGCGRSKQKLSLSTRRVGQVKSMGDCAFLGERRVERKDGGSVTQLALRMPWLLG